MKRYSEFRGYVTETVYDPGTGSFATRRVDCGFPLEPPAPAHQTERVTLPSSPDTAPPTPSEVKMEEWEQNFAEVA